MALRADDVDLDRDRRLVELAQAGEAAAFAELYDRYFGRLGRYCRRRGLDPHTAEEVAQEAFARAWAGLPRFGGERRFYPWLTVIASRLCVDHQRRAGRAVPVAELDPGPVADHHDDLWGEVDRAQLRAALARVNERHREVLRLREGQGWAYDRIAEFLGVPMTTVESLLHRARRSLRREFLATDDERLATVPVLGWLVGRLAGWRSRAVEALGQTLAPAAPAALGVAAAVAVSVAVVAGSAGSAPAEPPAVDRATSPPVSAPVRSTAAEAPADPPAPARDATGAATDRDAPTSTSARVGPAEVMLGDDSERARDEARAKPVTVDEGGVTLGVDPGDVTETVARQPDRLEEFLGGKR